MSAEAPIINRFLRLRKEVQTIIELVTLCIAMGGRGRGNLLDF